MLQIKKEFKSLIPPLTKDEFEQLERNCLEEGIRDAIVTWQGYIIDGHNRYEISLKYGLEIKTETKDFKNVEEVKEWMILNQFGRRNLSNYQRSVLALQLEEFFSIKAKEKQKGGQGGVLLKQNSAEAKPIETRKELSKVANVSHDTIAKVKKIQEKATEEVKAKLSTGEVSINSAYQEIKKEENKSLFKQGSLREKFIEPPFSVLDLKQGSWSKRKSMWLDLGIKSEIGRKTNTHGSSYGFAERFKETTSIFNPALCEVLYHWFCPQGGKILDPFAGGSVRGIVANKLGYNYTGIDVRQDQIDSNKEQAIEILGVDNQPNYYVGDSNLVLNDFTETFDYLFTCPPYADLEVYSDLEGDISNMSYDSFINVYKNIIEKSCNLLKKNSFACFVVGEVRDKNGNYYGFVPDTIKIFQNCGMSFYNEAILLDQLGSASMRANNTMKNKKLVKVHQNILVFKK
jgi:DNA modification methylase